MQQRTKEWHELRKKFIGASDAAALLGVSPWKCAYDVFLEKSGSDTSVPVKNPWMQRGIDLESEALRLFEKEMGFLMSPKVLFSDRHKFMMASLDGLDIDGSHACEIKCPGEKDHEIALGNEIPEKYIPQLQHQIEVAGLEDIYYCSYRPEHLTPIYILNVPRDQAYIDKLVEVERKFYEEHMLTGIPPENDRHVVRIDSEVWKSLTDEYRRLDRQEKESQKRKDEIRDFLVQIAQEENAQGNGIILQKVDRKGIIDYKNIPVLKTMDLEEFRKPGSSYWQVKESNET